MPQDPRQLTQEDGRTRLRAVMEYLCLKYPHPDELSNARLTKLVYLADWEAARHFGHQLTPVKWVFNHYGPWVPDVMNMAQSEPETFLVVTESNSYGSPKIRIALSHPPQNTSLDPHEQAVLDRVIEETRKLYFGPFIDYVYATYPVRASERYDELDLAALAKNDPEPEPLLQLGLATGHGGLHPAQTTRLLDAIDTLLAEDIGSDPPGDLEDYFAQWIENPTLEAVDDLSFVSIEKTLDDTLLVTVTAYISVEGFVSHQDMYTRDLPDELVVRDADWNERYQWVSMSEIAEFAVEFSGTEPEHPPAFVHAKLYIVPREED
jgi:hypothetical protein